jgi:hypothetical protein
VITTGGQTGRARGGLAARRVGVSAPHAAAAQPFDVPDVGLTGDRSAVVQDVSEVVAVEDIQAGLVNIQDAVNGASAGAPDQGP